MQTLLLNVGAWVVPLLFALCFTGLAFVLLRALNEGADNYAQEYAQEAARQFEDLFLFIPAKRIADLARTLAVTVFILLFFVFGDVSTSSGIMVGTVLGLLGGIGALQLPRFVVSVLRHRRLERFNNQLVESLNAMSNALRAGFSILQAFESIVKENRNPISLEFGLFLQQTRIGVRFEDALRNLEDRVGSEDLTIMVRSIEIARMTGGNLTEVFDQIAEVIRERIRIQGRIKSLTSMGRMQAVVVGSIPAVLFFAMMLIDPQMMKGFIASGAGISMMVLVVMLVVTGFLVIRKIVSIDV